MATRQEHYISAEAWLFKAEHADARGGQDTIESCAMIAQVHAALAGVSISAAPQDYREEWAK